MTRLFHLMADAAWQPLADRNFYVKMESLKAAVLVVYVAISECIFKKKLSFEPTPELVAYAKKLKCTESF